MAEPGSAAVPRAASATGLDPAQAGTGLDAALAIDMTSAPQRTAPPPRTAAPKQGGMLPEAHDSLPDVPMGLLVLLAALGMMALTMRRRPG